MQSFLNRKVFHRSKWIRLVMECCSACFQGEEVQHQTFLFSSQWRYHNLFFTFVVAEALSQYLAFFVCATLAGDLIIYFIKLFQFQVK